MMMEFLVDMVTTVPDGTTDAEVDAMRIREAARSRDLAAQGHLLRLWRPPLHAGEWRTWGLFQAADATELESVLSSPIRLRPGLHAREPGACRVEPKRPVSGAGSRPSGRSRHGACRCR